MSEQEGDHPSPDAQDPVDLREEWGGSGGGWQSSGAGSTQPIPGPDRSAASAAAVETTSRRKVRGVVRDIRMRTDPHTQHEKLTFRVERYDAGGNRLPPVPVEMNRYRGGSLTEGDEVEVGGRWSGGNLRAKRVRNLTTSADVRGRGLGLPGAKWIVAGVVLVVLVAGGFAAYYFVRDNVSKDDIPTANGFPLPSTEPAAQPDQQSAQSDSGQQDSSTDTSGQQNGGGGQNPAPQQSVTTQPEPTHEQQQVSLENVLGRPVDEATHALESSGLRTTVVEEPDQDVPAGRVISTEPAPGSTVDEGSQVTLHVSSGPTSETS